MVTFRLVSSDFESNVNIQNFEIAPNTAVWELKRKLAQESRIPERRLVMYFQGIFLRDTYMLNGDEHIVLKILDRTRINEDLTSPSGFYAKKEQRGNACIFKKYCVKSMASSFHK